MARFAAEANDSRPSSRAEMAKDKALRARYESWWFGKRRDFLLGLRDAVHAELPKAEVLFTPWNDEAGPALPGSARLVVTDVPADFRGGLDGPGGRRAQSQGGGTGQGSAAADEMEK